MLKKMDCGGCPACKRFDSAGVLLQDCEKTFLQEWCTSFVGLPLISKKTDKICPCLQIGEKALLRAHLAIEQWDKGWHPWQEEAKRAVLARQSLINNVLFWKE